MYMYVKTANPTSQKMTFGANTNLAPQRRIFWVIFRDKISTCVFDFQRRIIIAILTEFHILYI